MTDDDFYDDAPARKSAPERFVYPGLPSTVLELRNALINYDVQRPRSLQRELGPSELGTPCDQQIARKLIAGTVQRAHEPAWAPWQGTQVHNGMDDVLDFWNKALSRERWRKGKGERLDIAPGITGESDAYDNDHAMVVDWKHTGNTALRALLVAQAKGLPPAEQMSPEYRVQAHLYGLGHVRAGRPVRLVRVVLLARSWKYDDSQEWTEPFDESVAIAALKRYERIREQVRALPLAERPDAIAQVPATPSSKCWWCPFRRTGYAADQHGCPGK